MLAEPTDIWRCYSVHFQYRSEQMQQLLNPFAQKYPEAVDCTLSSQASNVRFNPSGPFAGHYLAAGCLDGLVEIWDVETRGVMRILEGHVKAVGGLSWSRNNRYLLSSSLDGTAIIWDLSVLPHPSLRPSTPAHRSPASSSTSRLQTIRFDGPLSNAEFHPRNSKIFLATLTCNEVVLVDLRKGESKILKDVMQGENGDIGAENGEAADEKANGHAKKKSSLTCAAFSPCGSRIYAGTSQGFILIIDPPSLLVVQRIKVANSGIRQMAFDASGQNIILSSSDRALRVLLVSPLTGFLTPIHRFQDLVNRTSWNSIGFSGDGEYVMGGAGHKQAHNIFIWDRDGGTLIKVLEGPKEHLIACDWHPTRPVIASVTVSGDIHIWQTTSPDNWAAFAPGFEELEENVEYDEREDEFDIEDETELSRRKDAEEDLQIDVLTPPEDSYPRHPNPLISLPPGLHAKDEETGEETEASKNAREILEVLKWAEEGGDDGDGWEGFYLSLDLLDEVDEEVGG